MPTPPHLLSACSFQFPSLVPSLSLWSCGLPAPSPQDFPSLVELRLARSLYSSSEADLPLWSCGLPAPSLSLTGLCVWSRGLPAPPLRFTDLCLWSCGLPAPFTLSNLYAADASPRVARLRCPSQAALRCVTVARVAAWRAGGRRHRRRSLRLKTRIAPHRPSPAAGRQNCEIIRASSPPARQKPRRPDCKAPT